MRTFEPLDVVRCFGVGMNGLSNLAVTSVGLCQPQSFYAFLLGVSRRRLLPRAKGRALALAAGWRVQAIAAVRPRSGAKSWEVSHLYADPDSGNALTGLLEQAAVASAYGGAERVFLRVESDSDIVRAARLAGFFPCFRETLYRGLPSTAESANSLFDADSRSIKRHAGHDHALFRLYNAATPLKARQLVGMTLEQWKDSREPAIRRSDERVLELEGAVRGWFGTSARSGAGRIEIMLHPDYAALTPNIVDSALRSLVRTRSVVAIVPEYVPLLGGALEERGFRPEGEFVVLVKSIARMARQPVASRSSLVVE